jgi:hypothetical protein
MGPTALQPFRRKSCCGFFISRKNSSSSAGLEPADLERNGKHVNHYTTEGDNIGIKSVKYTPKRKSDRVA